MNPVAKLRPPCLPLIDRSVIMSRSGDDDWGTPAPVDPSSTFCTLDTAQSRVSTRREDSRISLWPRYVAVQLCHVLGLVN